MSRVSDNEPAQREARRKILRAGFGVPVVTAVASGSALAASSTTCLARQVQSPIFPEVKDSLTADSYWRVRLHKTGSGMSKTFYVDGNVVAGLGLQYAPGYGVTAGKYQQFNIGTNQEVGSVLDLATTPPTPNYTQSQKYAVLRFNANGQIVGVGMPLSGTGSSAAIRSCWSSFRPTA